MAAGSIVIDLLMRTGAFETDTKRAEKALERFKKQASDVGKSVGIAFAGFAAGAAALVKGSIDAADSMLKMSQSTGVAIEQLSALTYAGELAGVNQDQLGSALVKLGKNMVDAADGTGAAQEAFEALGISVKNTDGTLKTSDQVLSEVAGKFAMYKDGAEKTALAVAIFGKAGADLIPLLNGGADGLAELAKEAESLGVILDTKSAKAAENFNDNLTKLGFVKDGLVQRITKDLLPSLESLTARLFDSAKGSTALDSAARIAATGVRLLASVGVIIGAVFKTIGEYVGGVAATLVAFFSGEFQQAFNIAKNTVADVGSNIKNAAGTIGAIFDDTANKIESKSEANANKTAAPFLKGAAKVAKAGKAIRDEAAKIFADIEKQIGAISRQIQLFGASDTTVKLFDLQSAGATPEQLSRAKELLLQLEMLNKAKEESEEKTRAQAEIEKEIASIYEGTRTPIEKLNAELERLNFLRGKGLDENTFNRAQGAAFKNFDDTFNGTKEKAEEVKDLAKEFGLAFSTAFEDAIVGGKGLNGVLQGLQKTVISIFARQFITKPFENLVSGFAENAFKGSGGGGGGFISSALSSLFGGGSGILGFANGGTPPVGKVSLVGERGPELFVPNTAGRIIPNNMLGMGSSNSSNVYNINVRVPEGTSRSTGSQIAADLQRKLAYGSRNN